jgi:hypothetical protein
MSCSTARSEAASRASGRRRRFSGGGGWRHKRRRPRWRLRPQQRQRCSPPLCRRRRVAAVAARPSARRRLFGSCSNRRRSSRTPASSSSARRTLRRSVASSSSSGARKSRSGCRRKRRQNDSVTWQVRRGASTSVYASASSHQARRFTPATASIGGCLLRAAAVPPPVAPLTLRHLPHRLRLLPRARYLTGPSRPPSFHLPSTSLTEVDILLALGAPFRPAQGPQPGPPTGPGSLQTYLATVAAAECASCPHLAMEAAASGAGGIIQWDRATAVARLGLCHNSGYGTALPSAMPRDWNIGGRRESLPSGRCRLVHHSSGTRSRLATPTHSAGATAYCGRIWLHRATPRAPYRNSGAASGLCVSVCHNSGECVTSCTRGTCNG